MPYKDNSIPAVSKIAVCLLCLFGLASYALAQEGASLEDKLISATFKSLARVFISSVDLQGLKKANIAKLEKMDEEKFRQRYRQVYDSLSGLPAAFKVRYGLLPVLGRSDCIRKIALLDKPTAYAIVEGVPDEFIASCFKRYLAAKKEQIRQSALVQQIKLLWQKMLKGAV